MDNYIIRIYRRNRNNHQNLVGTVEKVGCDEKKGFTNLEELWDILTRKICKNQKERRTLNGSIKSRLKIL